MLAQFATENHRVMSDSTVGHLINMLRDAVDQGTGQAVRTRFGLRADVAGKTGTTQKNTDGWFILMHPRLVAGSWVGFNDSRITMRSNYWGEGGHNAVLLVGDFFQHILDARFIDGGAQFPYARPRESFWDPFLNVFREWWLGDRLERAPWPPSGEPERQAPRDRAEDALEQQRAARELERERQKERLMERLRQKREQWEQERRERDRYLPEG
jgi:penicillin-binding protein 1A